MPWPAMVLRLVAGGLRVALVAAVGAAAFVSFGGVVAYLSGSVQLLVGVAGTLAVLVALTVDRVLVTSELPRVLLGRGRDDRRA